MTPNYDTYTTLSLDENFNVYQTVVVEGSTTGSCYFYYTCGPNGQRCQGTYPNCVGAVHTPKINNVIGAIGGWTTGPAAYPFSYLSYQTTNSVNLQPGQTAQSTVEGDVTCSSLGSILAISSSWTVSIKVATYAFTAPSPGGGATYHLACPAGTVSTCGTANYLGSQSHLWAEEFTVYTDPGGCWFVHLVQYKDGPPAPYPCT